MAARENQVVYACLNLLVRYGGCWAWRQQSGMMRIADATRRQGARVVSFGGVQGAPDIMAVIGKGEHRGRFLGVECKAPKGHPVLDAGLGGRRKRPGQQTEHQRYWQQRCEEAGGLYLVVTSSEELEAKLREWGVL